jgi:pilus assembly protein Flp/PilA
VFDIRIKVGKMGGRMEAGMSMVVRVFRKEDGQALVEYALILFFIAIVCITVLTALGGRVSAVLQSIVTGL